MGAFKCKCSRHIYMWLGSKRAFRAGEHMLENSCLNAVGLMERELGYIHCT